MLSIFFKGFFTGSGLIIAIGAQNAFVIRQGALRQHVFVTAALCFLIDAALISCGVLGFGSLVTKYPILISLTKYFAVIFLTLYGFFAWKAAWRKTSILETTSGDSISLQKTVLMILGLSLLNPHVYLDTVLLLGSIASQQPDQSRWLFGVGACLASALWFFGLAYGSSALAPLLRKPTTWRVLNSLIAVSMWFVALTCIF